MMRTKKGISTIIPRKRLNDPMMDASHESNTPGIIEYGSSGPHGYVSNQDVYVSDLDASTGALIRT